MELLKNEIEIEKKLEFFEKKKNVLLLHISSDICLNSLKNLQINKDDINWNLMHLSLYKKKIMIQHTFVHFMFAIKKKEMKKMFIYKKKHWIQIFKEFDNGFQRIHHIKNITFKHFFKILMPYDIYIFENKKYYVINEEKNGFLLLAKKEKNEKTYFHIVQEIPNSGENMREVSDSWDC